MGEGHALQVREEPGAELGDLTLRISLRPHSETGATNEPVCWRRKQRLKAREQGHWSPGSIGLKARGGLWRVKAQAGPRRTGRKHRRGGARGGGGGRLGEPSPGRKVRAAHGDGLESGPGFKSCLHRFLVLRLGQVFSCP